MRDDGLIVGRNPEILWRSTSQGPVLLKPHDDDPITLTGLTAVVWTLVEAPVAVDELDVEASDLLGPLPELRGQVDAMLGSSLLVSVDGE